MTEHTSEDAAPPAFPFFGAGTAHYYEWARLAVRFEREPTAAEREAIVAALPSTFTATLADDEDAEEEPEPTLVSPVSGGAIPQLVSLHPEEDAREAADLAAGRAAADGSWRFAGRMLGVIAGGYVNAIIEQEYRAAHPDAVGPLPTPAEAGWDEDIDEDVFALYYVSDEAAAWFEAATEAWLRATHEICSIQYVVRPEDFEAGGTELSAWHEASVAGGAALVTRIAAEPGVLDLTGDDRDRLATTIGTIIAYSDVDIDELPEAFVVAYLQKWRFQRVLDRGNKQRLTALLAVFGGTPTEATRNEWDNWWRTQTLRIGRRALRKRRFGRALQCLRILLDYEPGDYVAVFAVDIVERLVGRGKPAVAAALAEALSGHGEDHGTLGEPDSVLYLNQITSAAYEYAGRGKWKKSIEAFEIALSITSPLPPVTRLEGYCNALYPLQYDNSGLPVNADKNRWFLERCLPYAPRNPAIWFNAACLYVEMDELAEAAACVRSAVEDGYDGAAGMWQQLDTLPMFAAFRATPEFAALPR